jgi:hypothetical protein
MLFLEKLLRAICSVPIVHLGYKLGRNMWKYEFLILLGIGLLIFNPLTAVNHLDIMQIIEGEYNESKMGKYIAAPDFNGDGIKDLVVAQPGWAGPDPQTTPAFGRILFYWGCANFDIVPDFILEGQPNNHLIASNMICPGDMNNDGYDDLCIVRLVGYYPDWFYRICVFFGGEYPSSTPGFWIDLPRDSSEGICGVEAIMLRSVGDVNGDNNDDVGLIIFWSYPDHKEVTFLLGGSFTFFTVYDTYTETSTVPAIGGVGDVNNDGFDDFILGFTHNNQVNCSNVVLHYGNLDISSCITDTLATDSSLDYQMKPGAVGDVNNDGYADFLGRLLWDGSEDWGALWLGGNDITPQYEVEMRPAYFGHLWGDWGLAFGDLNGDGFDDVIGSDYSMWGDDGRLAIWLGSGIFNGLPDLYIRCPDEIPALTCFGYAMTVGDFNDDGYSDLAVGAPQSSLGLSPRPGSVVIFAGNGLLIDSTVANDDELIPNISDNWELSLYPNPLPQNALLSISYIGESYKHVTEKTITLYNLKGQEVATYTDYNLTEVKLTLPQLSSGVYLLQVGNGAKTLKTQKFVVTK